MSILFARPLILEDLAEDLLVLGVKDPSPVHHPGHDVVKRSASSEEAGGSHGERLVIGDGVGGERWRICWKIGGFRRGGKRCLSFP